MVIIEEHFEVADDTNVNGYNDWVVKLDSGTQDNNVLVKSNNAAVTNNGARYAYKAVQSGLLLGYDVVCTLVQSRYTGSGNRYVNRVVLGSTDVSTRVDFLANSISFGFGRSDSNDSIVPVQIFDGSTLVASKNLNFVPNGDPATYTLNLNVDGSGTLQVTQGANSDSVAWSARTWTNGTGQYFGYWFGFSGTDGLGQLSRTQFTDFYCEGGPTNTYAISGEVTLSGTPVEGAIVRCIRQSDNFLLTAQTTDSDGLYSFSSLDSDEFYHLCVEFEDQNQKYYTYSYWDIEPVLVT